MKLRSILIPIVLAVAFVLMAGLAHAASVQEAPIDNIGSEFCVDPSTSGWTLNEPTTPLQKRTGLKVNNLASHSASVLGVLGKSAPTVATTTAAIEIQPGENPWVPISPNVHLYLHSLNSTTERICSQEGRQEF